MQPDEKGQLVFFLTDTVKAGCTLMLDLRTDAADHRQDAMMAEQTDRSIRILAGNKTVLEYHSKRVPAPTDSPAYYGRSGFIHPLYSPSGTIITDDFPVAHAHQHGIFSGWVHTLYRGIPIDFWNAFRQQGEVAHIAVRELRSGPVFALLRVALEHRSFRFGKILDEEWQIQVFRKRDSYLIDFTSIQTNSASDTLFLLPYHYGGFGIRGSAQWDPSNKNKFRSNPVVSADGRPGGSRIDQGDIRWISMQGEIDRKRVGFTLVPYPQQPRYPQPVRVHPSMPYISCSPVIRGTMVMVPGRSFRYQYLILSYDTTPDPKWMQQWIDYQLQPPLLQWVSVLKSL